VLEEHLRFILGKGGADALSIPEVEFAVGGEVAGM
jgi:hypothetical protein